MAYLDTHRAGTTEPAVRHPAIARLFPLHPAALGRPALERALRERTHDVQQMLVAALLAAATIIVVAATLLLRS